MKLPVQACRTQVALFRRPADFGRRGPVYGDFVQGIYFKPTHGEMIHAGSLAGEEMQDPVDPGRLQRGGRTATGCRRCASV